VKTLINRRAFNVGISAAAGITAIGLPALADSKPVAAYVYYRKSISGRIWVTTESGQKYTDLDKLILDKDGNLIDWLSYIYFNWFEGYPRYVRKIKQEVYWRSVSLETALLSIGGNGKRGGRKRAKFFAELKAMVHGGNLTPITHDQYLAMFRTKDENRLMAI